MKKLHILTILLVFLLVSCGKSQQPVTNVAKDNSVEIGIETEPIIEIVWGYYWEPISNMVYSPKGSQIAQILNERFNVTMKSVPGVNKIVATEVGNGPQVTAGTYETTKPPSLSESRVGGFFAVPGHSAAMRTEWEEMNNPDIFIAPIDDNNIIRLIETGRVREIPWNMIRDYAPRYFAMSGGQDGDIARLYKNNYGGDYFMFGLAEFVEMLTTYSVYRLDWLEEIGYLPHGNPIELEDRIYFTDEAFTIDEFIEIMTLFEKEYQLKPLALGDFFQYSIEPLMGMFGVNWSNIEQDGKANFAQAGDGFKNFLYFMEFLNNLDVIYIQQFDETAAYEAVIPKYNELPHKNNKDNPYELSILYTFIDFLNVGWWSDDIDRIIGENGYNKYILHGIDSTFKLLITPPEIGPNGVRGVSSNRGPSGNSGDKIITSEFMISSEVTDEKLAKILEIFDAVSFEPELCMMTHYGFEGIDYKWEGEPYNSRVIVNHKLLNDLAYAGVFSTRTIDGNARKMIYDIPSQLQSFYDYATSTDAKNCLIPSYMNDPQGVFKDELIELYKRYENFDPVTAGYDYMSDIISGRRRVDDTWNDYIAGLKATGLNEFTELINKYPVKYHQSLF